MVKIVYQVEKFDNNDKLLLVLSHFFYVWMLKKLDLHFGSYFDSVHHFKTSHVYTRHTCTHVTRVLTVARFLEIQLQIPFRLEAKCESDLTDKLKADNYIFSVRGDGILFSMLCH